MNTSNKCKLLNVQRLNLENSFRFNISRVQGHEDHGDTNPRHVEGKLNIRWLFPSLQLIGLAEDHLTSKWGNHRLNSFNNTQSSLFFLKILFIYF